MRLTGPRSEKVKVFGVLSSGIPGTNYRDTLIGSCTLCDYVGRFVELIIWHLKPVDPCPLVGPARTMWNGRPPTGAAEMMAFAMQSSLLLTHRDAMTLLAELLFNQLVCFTGVSKEWRRIWGNLPKLTRATTADTSISQLQWSFDSGDRKIYILRPFIAEHCEVDILRCPLSKGCGFDQNGCFMAAAKAKLKEDSNGCS